MKGSRVVSWIVGAALLSAVILAALHFTDVRDVVDVLRSANPWWLLVALALQTATYVCEGEVWRIVSRAANVDLPLREATVTSPLPG